MNGNPRPNDHARSRVAPMGRVADEAAIVRMEPRIGPMHGVQPMAKAEPVTTERP